jgi:hypothetical protein
VGTDLEEDITLGVVTMPALTDRNKYEKTTGFRISAWAALAVSCVEE